MQVKNREHLLVRVTLSAFLFWLNFFSFFIFSVLFFNWSIMEKPSYMLPVPKGFRALDIVILDMNLTKKVLEARRKNSPVKHIISFTQFPFRVSIRLRIFLLLL